MLIQITFMEDKKSLASSCENDLKIIIISMINHNKATDS